MLLWSSYGGTHAHAHAHVHARVRRAFGGDPGKRRKLWSGSIYTLTRVLRVLRPSSTRMPSTTGQGGPFRPLSSGILPFPIARPSSPQSCWLGWSWGLGAMLPGLPELWVLTVEKGEAEARRRQGGWRGKGNQEHFDRSRWVCSPHFTDVPGGQGTKGLIGLVLPGLQGARMLVALQGRAAPFTGKRGLCSLRLTATR